MGFIKAFSGAISNTFADQWLDYYQPKANISATAGLYPAVQNNLGENTKGNECVISNGSKIIVPEGTALITMQDGEITGFITEPGGFIFRTDDPNSQSIFAGDGIVSSLVKSTWDKVKFGGQPATQQLAFYVNLKAIPNNKFGTQGEIYWDDAFFGTQVGAVARGTYVIHIMDPLLFVKNFVPSMYLQPNAPTFDFADMENDACSQLFNDVVSSLSSAFSLYTNDPNKGNRISKIQSDSVGFAASLSEAVESAARWKTSYGLEITQVSITSIEYDEDTKELMKEVKKADAFAGARGNTFMQMSVARGIEAAGQNGGGTGMAFMGMGMNAANGMMGSVQQPNTNAYQNNLNQQTQPSSQATQQNVEDPATKLLKMKELLDAGAISQEEYDKVKAQVLGI